jgi:hypothetical protein
MQQQWGEQSEKRKEEKRSETRKAEARRSRCAKRSNVSLVKKSTVFHICSDYLNTVEHPKLDQISIITNH